MVGLGDEVTFELRLGQTIAWCQSRCDASDPAGSLRSPSLRPSVLAANRAGAVRLVCDHRCAWDAATRAAGPASTVAGGRLLVFAPDETLCDGAAEEETNGFFDVENAPPWDSWVALFHCETWPIGSAVQRDHSCDYLVSWVPSAYVDVADRGIEVNPETCIMWLDNAHVPLTDYCRERGLLPRD